jgi:hypothetical protein
MKSWSLFLPPLIAILALMLNPAESFAAVPAGPPMSSPCDATCLAPAPLLYQEPDAVSAENAVNALNAVNCTGGVSGHCAGADPSTPGGGLVSYRPIPSDQSAFASWNNEASVSYCAQFTLWTAYRIPWAEYVNGEYVMMMPESASAAAEQAMITAEHIPPAPNPWTDSMTLTLSVVRTVGGLRPPPTGHVCP